MAVGLALVVAGSGIAAVVPLFLRRAIDGIRSGAPIRQVWILAGAMVGLSLIGGLARFGMREILNGISRWVEYDIRNDLFERLVTLDATFYARYRTGDLMARATNDLAAVRMAAGPAIMYLVNTVAGGLFALYFMLRIDARLTLLAVLPMIVLPVMGIAIGRAIHKRFEAVQEHFGKLTTLAQENIAGVRVVRAYRQERAEVSRFADLSEQYLGLNMRLASLYGVMSPAFQMFAGFGMVVVLWGGGLLVVHGAITVGAFVAFGMYLAMLTWPLIALGWVINLFQRGAASMGRLLEILDERSALAVPDESRHLPASQAGRTLEFRDVGFHYPTHEGDEIRWVLRHVSFTAPAGSTIGLVGATGSGKSALMDLIPRLYDPQEGQVLLDGIPVDELPLDELRREIGYVSQESFLFGESIGDNLAYGTGDAASARWAAGVAQLADTIESFPGGYETLLGERGINLSGGQKQRATLARALARRPNVVLLDDALSAVDTHTEAEILGALRDALAGRTALIASHRVSAIRDATWIIVLEDGRVVEQGRHHDLIAAGGRYWALLNRQQLEESIEAGSAMAAGGNEQ